MRMISLFIQFYLITLSVAKTASVVKGEKGFEVLKSRLRGSVAWGSYENTVNKTGWGVLDIHTNPKYTATDQAYAAGYIESYMTHHLIYLYWKNFLANEYNGKVPHRVREFFSMQFRFWKKNIFRKPDDFDDENYDEKYWSQQRLIYEQLKGLYVGYKHFSSACEKLKLEDIYLLNSVGDLPTVSSKYSHGYGDNSMLDLQEKHPDEIYHECTAYIKFNNKTNDVIYSHNTWRPYYAMLRIYKNYYFPYTQNAFPMSFASSPGLIHSKDDFYQLQSKNDHRRFGVMETTNSFYIKKLYKKIDPFTLLSWQRVLVAMYFQKTCKKVVETIGKYNSGTYNNQWMVLDLKNVTEHAKDNANLLFIGEQMPGRYEVLDVTPTLVKTTFWASYNTPYIKSIYINSGYLKKVKLGKKEYSYTKCTRARLFKRDGARMHTIDDVKKLMTMNHYKTDKLAKKPRNQIASRYDLEKYDMRAPFGAVDCKIGAASLGKTTLAYCGPTKEGGLPPFDWKRFPKVQHDGTPAVFNFDWVEMTPMSD
ncbi:hypothetical protein EIN_155270 [Entamoeba invadens IP1]|uniref:Phospholipase B-like n=1 Tax=Entamoeba invadens IP1 TaxID=370355 RepID=A0A0A1U920_ENTIV|nr:hypothetical protein EIN_155270 [Entamoeba invadens IP1]ELP91420.1 hypothetical protein EIN_155270 [Entamoeba invadens IP1]|eukprot:XP_004258191.1 hypothetical protein EIN_155270 [Entamoeba invadens IP1]